MLDAGCRSVDWCTVAPIGQYWLMADLSLQPVMCCWVNWLAGGPHRGKWLLEEVKLKVARVCGVK